MIDPNLMILAGGVSSRMKKSIAESDGMDPSVKQEAEQKSKSMITVGYSQRPFLDYLLFNARDVGYDDILIIVSEHDTSIRDYYGSKEKDNSFKGLRISYAVQRVPAGRTKPLGTADAVKEGLITHTEWKGRKFTVCNSDNLYSRQALRLLFECKHPNAMIDYDRSALQFESSRISQFSVTQKDSEGFLVNILEKPSAEEVERARGRSTYVGVSMNIFRLDYDMVFPFLRDVPLHPERGEKELPVAVNMMIHRHPKSMFAFPLAEHVPDLTSLHDLQNVQQYLAKEFSRLNW